MSEINHVIGKADLHSNVPQSVGRMIIHWPTCRNSFKYSGSVDLGNGLVKVLTAKTPKSK